MCQLLMCGRRFVVVYYPCFACGTTIGHDASWCSPQPFCMSRGNRAVPGRCVPSIRACSTFLLIHFSIVFIIIRVFSIFLRLSRMHVCRCGCLRTCSVGVCCLCGAITEGVMGTRRGKKKTRNDAYLTFFSPFLHLLVFFLLPLLCLHSLNGAFSSTSSPTSPSNSLVCGNATVSTPSFSDLVFSCFFSFLPRSLPSEVHLVSASHGVAKWLFPFSFSAFIRFL